MFTRRRNPVADRLQGHGLARRDAERLSQHGTIVRIPDGEALCTEGERGLQAFVILEGEAKVLTPETVITLGPGDVVGELATLDRRRTRNATVVAGPDLEALVYDVRTFQHLAADPALRSRLAPEGRAA